MSPVKRKFSQSRTGSSKKLNTSETKKDETEVPKSKQAKEEEEEEEEVDTRKIQHQGPAFLNKTIQMKRFKGIFLI